LHLVSAWAADQRLTLVQVAADANTNELDALPRLLDWLDLIGVVVTVDALGCQTTTKIVDTALRRRLCADDRADDDAELRYFVDSRRASVRPFAQAVRSHWSIENGLHWLRDVICSEDASRIRKGVGAQDDGAPAVRGSSLLHRAGDTWADRLSLRFRRKAAVWSTDARVRIHFG
jgi:predicted transposase YbfD/YdcC